MNPVYLRLLEIAHELGQEDPVPNRYFEDLLGLSSGRISQIKRHDSIEKVGQKGLTKLSQLGYNPEWVNEGAPNNKRIADRKESNYQSNSAYSSINSAIPHEDDYATISQFHVNGSCGDGYLNEHVEVRGSMAFKRDWISRMNIDPDQAGVIYAKGESMAPTIQDGEVLLVDYRQKEPQGNKVYVLNVDGDLRVKRLLRRVAGWVIISDNQDKTRYPDEPIPDPHMINIIGRVVWRGGGI